MTPEADLEAEVSRLKEALDLQIYITGSASATIENRDAEIERLKGYSKRIQALVDQQALNEGLWFHAETAPEAYLQQELRKLHALIEDPNQGGDKK